MMIEARATITKGVAIMAHYEVIVSNVGTVYSGTNQRQAIQVYREYLDMVRLSAGRCAGEDVTLMKDDEIEMEYTRRAE